MLAGPVQPKAPRAATITLCEAGEADANDGLVLLWALMLCVTHVGALKTLEEWARAVMLEAPQAHELGCKWVPSSESWPRGKFNVPCIYDPLVYAHQKVSWPEPTLDAIGLAMQAWRGNGHVDGLRGSLLKNYIHKPPIAIRPSIKDNKPRPRYRSWAVVRVAQLLLKRGVALRKLLHLDAAADEAKPAHVVMIELSQRVQVLEAELLAQKVACKKLQDAWRHAAGRLKEKNHAVTNARRDERAKLSEKHKGFRHQCRTEEVVRAEEAVKDELERKRRKANKAHARARAGRGGSTHWESIKP